MDCSRKMPDTLVQAVGDFRDGADRNALLVLCHGMGRVAELTAEEAILCFHS